MSSLWERAFVQLIEYKKCTENSAITNCYYENSYVINIYIYIFYLIEYTMLLQPANVCK